MILPEPITEGATIGIIAPASPQRDPERLVRGVQYLESKGYRVVLGEHVHKQYAGYLAGTDEERVADIHAMFRNPDIKLILCSRGGYGSSRFLHLVDWELLRTNPKPFVGFSDITSFQLAAWHTIQLVTYSGAMPSVDMADGFLDFSEQHFWTTLHSPLQRNPIPADNSIVVLQEGAAVGTLIPANLSTLVSLLGTRYMPTLHNSVLVLEDIGEVTYRIDRMLTQLAQYLEARKEKPSAILFGQWSQPTTPVGTTPARDIIEVLQEATRITDGLVAANLPYGHVARKLTLPVGAWVEITL